MINIFTLNFVQFNAFLLNKCTHLFLKKEKNCTDPKTVNMIEWIDPPNILYHFVAPKTYMYD